jgi:Uma2 family endonuclease
MGASGIRYLREVRPLDFPSSDPEWEMSESTTHQQGMELLRSIVRTLVDDKTALVGSDQFVYFDASNPRRKCAPDVFVKMGMPWRHFESWKTWQDGVPELCVEILSPREFEKLTLEQKLRRFHIMGVPEVVAFDREAPVGTRLRAWDLVSGDLLERRVDEERTPCLTLGKTWCIGPAPMHSLESALRLSHDSGGVDLLPSALERERHERERERHEREREREDERREKEALLIELQRLRGSSG